MRKIVCLILLCLLCGVGSATNKLSLQRPNSKNSFERFTVGARGGASSYIVGGDYKSQIGFNVVLDFQYTHIFKRRNRTSPFVGITTGLSFGYQSGGLEGAYNSEFSTTDASGDRVDYTVTTGNVKESLGEVQMQIPLFFTLLYNGLYLNAGPKFAIPLYSHYSQTITDPHITAYYMPYGVTIKDRLITGVMPDDQLNTSGSWKNSALKLYLSAEIGYEFIVSKRNFVGVGLYFDYNIYSTAMQAASEQGAISISQIGADPYNPAPTVKANSIVGSYSGVLSGFNAGLKITFHINYY